MFRKILITATVLALSTFGISPAQATDPLVLTFETDDTSFVKVDFPTDGNQPQASTLVAGTDGNTTRVLKIVRGVPSWAGTTVISDPAKTLITADAKLVTAKVFSPVAGVKLLIKVENRSNVTQSVESYATESSVVGWHEYTFDFAYERTGTEAFSANKTYNMASIFLDYTLNDGAVTTVGQTYYVDDVTFQAAASGGGNGNGGGSTPAVATLTQLTFEPGDVLGALAAFEAGPNHPQGVFGGGAGLIVAEPPLGGAGSAIAVTKSGQPWTGLNALVDTTGTVRYTDAAHPKIFFDLFSPKANSPVAVQLFVGDANVQATAMAKLGWNRVMVDFSTVPGWSSSTVYNKVVLFPDFLVPVSVPPITYFFDNVVVNGTAPMAFKPVASVGATLVGNTLKVGSRLSLSKGSWLFGAPVTYKYSWYRCSAKISSGVASLPSSKCKAISKQTSSTYKLTSSDRGKYVLGLVKATNSYGTTYSATKSIISKVK